MVYRNLLGTVSGFEVVTGSLPVGPQADDSILFEGNQLRYSAVSAKWIPQEPRRLAQLPFDTDIDDVEVIVTNARWPGGRRFTKRDGEWVDPDVAFECARCGCPQIIEPEAAGQRRIINSEADLTALKVAGTITPGDVIHLRHPTGGTGAGIYGYFDLRGALFTGRANPMLGGGVGAPVTFTADPDVLIGGGTGGVRDDAVVAVDVGEIDHVWVRNLKIVGGFQGVRNQGARGTAEQPQRVSHVDVSETTSARFAFQAFTGDITQWSEFIRYDCCKGHTELPGNANPEFSEGHYLGTGSVATIGQDRSHDVWINNGEFWGLTAETVECKPGVHRVWIDGVDARDMRFTPHGGGGVTGVFSLSVPGANYTPVVDDVEISLKNFTVDNYDDFYGVAIGHGGVTVENGKVTNGPVGQPAVRIRSVAPYGETTNQTPIMLRGIETSQSLMVQVWDPENQEPFVIDQTGRVDPPEIAWGTFTTDNSGTYQLVHRLGVSAPIIALYNVTTGEIHPPGGPSLSRVDDDTTAVTFAPDPNGDVFQWRAS